MQIIFLQTLPFFGLIGLGFLSVKTGFFSKDAIAALTKFVFYFALSAMIFGFAAEIDLAREFSWTFSMAYLVATLILWALVGGVTYALTRKVDEAALNAHVAVIGNVGFLGLPMLTMVMGKQAVAPILMVLAVDLVVFSTLFTVLVTGARAGKVGSALVVQLMVGILKNPMIMAVVLGLVFGALNWDLPGPAMAFVKILGAAATPCALFAIGGALAGQSATGLPVAMALTGAKLVLHPLIVAFFAFGILAVPSEQAAVMVAASALPVAGNVFILAKHFGAWPERVSATILVSTVIAVASVSAIISSVM